MPNNRRPEVICDDCLIRASLAMSCQKAPQAREVPGRDGCRCSLVGPDFLDRVWPLKDEIQIWEATVYAAKIDVLG
jgi:hypothetical protein